MYYMFLFLENNYRSFHCTGDSHWRKNIVAVTTQDRMIDDTLKIQTKIDLYILADYSS